MDQAAVIQHLRTALGGVDVVEASDDFYFFYAPGDGRPADHIFPFATLVTGDRHDQFSNLDRPGVYRLNVGVGKETFRELFGPNPVLPPADSPLALPKAAAGGPNAAAANSALPESSPTPPVADGEFDFAALDRLFPHPVYGRMYWVSVVNPSEATFGRVRPMLAEAHALAAKRQPKAKLADGA